MSEEYNNEVEQVDTEQEIQKETPDTQEQQSEYNPKESWREARELIGKQNETIRELTERQRKYEEYMRSLQEDRSPQEEEFDIATLPDDYIVEAKDVKRFRQKDQKRVEALERKQVMLDMRDKYDDFKRVCSADNIDKLEKTDPYLAQAIQATQDPYVRWELAYNGIKRNGIYKTQDKEQNDMLAGYNTSRPKSASQIKSSQSRSALGQAGAFSGVLTAEQKAEYYRNAMKKIQGE